MSMMYNIKPVQFLNQMIVRCFTICCFVLFIMIEIHYIGSKPRSCAIEGCSKEDLTKKHKARRRTKQFAFVNFLCVCRNRTLIRMIIRDKTPPVRGS